jgi:hypothetical protein
MRQNRQQLMLLVEGRAFAVLCQAWRLFQPRISPSGETAVWFEFMYAGPYRHDLADSTLSGFM